MGIWNKIQSKKKWNKGSDIYGVRDKEMISRDDAEGKLDYLDKNMGVTRSGFYHKYFNGYSEVRVDRPGKPYKVERVYTDPWIRQDIDNKSYVKVRILYGVLILVTAAMYLLGTIQNIGCNKSIYVAAPGYLAAIMMFPVIYVFVAYAKVPRKMTTWEYRTSSVRLYRFCLVEAILLAATALALLVYIILNPADEVLRTLLNLFLQLAGAVCMFIIYKKEWNMGYVDIPNDNVAPHGSQKIS